MELRHLDYIPNGLWLWIIQTAKPFSPPLFYLIFSQSNDAFASKMIEIIFKITPKATDLNIKYTRT